MEARLEKCTQAENDEEYVLLDLENVCMQADIPANAPYTLSGLVLDTLNPKLTVGNRLKLIGEYQETIGNCCMFCERDAEIAVKNTDIGSCGGNFPKDQQNTGGSNPSPCKHIRLDWLVASTQKILKFRLEADVQTENALCFWRDYSVQSPNIALCSDSNKIVIVVLQTWIFISISYFIFILLARPTRPKKFLFKF